MSNLVAPARRSEHSTAGALLSPPASFGSGRGSESSLTFLRTSFPQPLQAEDGYSLYPPLVAAFQEAARWWRLHGPRSSRRDASTEAAELIIQTAGELGFSTGVEHRSFGWFISCRGELAGQLDLLEEALAGAHLPKAQVAYGELAAALRAPVGPMSVALQEHFETIHGSVAAVGEPEHTKAYRAAVWGASPLSHLRDTALMDGALSSCARYLFLCDELVAKPLAGRVDELPAVEPVLRAVGEASALLHARLLQEEAFAW